MTYTLTDEVQTISGAKTLSGTTTFTGATSGIDLDDLTEGATNRFLTAGAQTIVGAKTFAAITTFSGATSGIDLDDLTEGATNKFLTAGAQTIAGAKTFSDATPSTSVTTGALKVTGGIGCIGSVVASALQVQEVVSANDIDTLPGRQIVAMDSASLNALKPGSDRFVVIDGPLNGSIAMNIRANTTDDRFIIVSNSSYLAAANPNVKLFEVGYNEGVVIPVQLKAQNNLTVGTTNQFTYTDSTGILNLSSITTSGIDLDDLTEGATNKFLTNGAQTITGRKYFDSLVRHQTLVHSGATLTLSKDVRNLILTHSSGAITITLPDIAGEEGIRFNIRLATTRDVTLNRSGTNLIADIGSGTPVSSLVVTADYSSIELISDGADRWYVI